MKCDPRFSMSKSLDNVGPFGAVNLAITRIPEVPISWEDMPASTWKEARKDDGIFVIHVSIRTVFLY